MILCQDVAKLRELVANFKKENKSIGLVPTMGALHEGHASLINASAKENDITIVSVFVNPTQFGPNEDYEAYPRTLENDCIVAQNAGADVVFAPKNKDLRRMVDDLFFNVELRIMPIVREADGLAKSSRNTYLSPEERKSALILSKSLKLAKEAFTNGQRDVEAILNLVKDTIQSEKTSQIDYVEMYKLPGLKPVGNKIEGRVLLALAVKFGTTRLIDNVILEDK